jgi:hypothetical protein
MEKNIRFWMLISELNNLTTILAIKCPEYQERVNNLKSELTDMILKGLEESKKLKETQIDSWYVRNN